MDALSRSLWIFSIVVAYGAHGGLKPEKIETYAPEPAPKNNSPGVARDNPYHDGSAPTRASTPVEEEPLVEQATTEPQKPEQSVIDLTQRLTAEQKKTLREKLAYALAFDEEVLVHCDIGKIGGPGNFSLFTMGNWKYANYILRSMWIACSAGRDNWTSDDTIRSLLSNFADVDPETEDIATARDKRVRDVIYIASQYCGAPKPQIEKLTLKNWKRVQDQAKEHFRRACAGKLHFDTSGCNQNKAKLQFEGGFSMETDIKDPQKLEGKPRSEEPNTTVLRDKDGKILKDFCADVRSDVALANALSTLSDVKGSVENLRDALK